MNTMELIIKIFETAQEKNLTDGDLVDTFMCFSTREQLEDVYKYLSEEEDGI